ncbi:hypothetical protein [Burkholderia cenocepacia]|uniref:hypothetical protein n=1 Tax=Burkholderia cenocepacia TaxID=95486 RepID=UPI00285B8D1D|nr:hypothetical protein [Burkholderia cenocepacia]MDR8035499.1 hypothetical protein [Burkholderia cenocepacia]
MAGAIMPDQQLTPHDSWQFSGNKTQRSFQNKARETVNFSRGDSSTSKLLMDCGTIGRLSKYCEKWNFTNFSEKTGTQN